jgi:hypothetical protein
MKTRTTIGIAIILGAIAGITIKSFFTSVKKLTQSPSQLKLEEIIIIRELHLVRHHYNDIFYLHRKGNPEKPVRAIVEVPVAITAYIDLKQVRIIKHNDSIREVILPRAVLDSPSYKIDKMVVTRMRSVHLHAGHDLYPKVSQYLQQTMATRIDKITAIAKANHILEQTEIEAKEYVESLLKAVGHTDIRISFATAPVSAQRTPLKLKGNEAIAERYMGVVKM